jgi:glycosyltransferase involved in cell wall biosynthesis
MRAGAVGPDMEPRALHLLAPLRPSIVGRGHFGIALIGQRQPPSACFAESRCRDRVYPRTQYANTVREPQRQSLGTGRVTVDPAVQAPRPLRVAAFTGGAEGSSRFRVRQYIAPLARLGIAVDERRPGLGSYPPRNRLLRPAWLAGTLVQRLPQLAAGWRADVTVLQREMVSTLPTLEGLARRPRLVDIDDAIHLLRGGRAARHLARLADLVVVGNAWLADVWRQWNPAVEVLPSPVDTDLYAAGAWSERPVIGWIGSGSNLRYLSGIAPALERVVSRIPGVIVAVCCERRPNLPGLPVRWVPWSEAVEAPFLASISVGVMPLDDGDWERGKCSFKMLQYMAAGRPCVVSPVGMNKDLLQQAAVGLAAETIDEWTEALSALLADRGAAERMGAAGRELAVTRYSVAALAPRLAGLLRRLA